MSLFRSTVAVAVALGATFATPCLAQQKYDTGATDTEIRSVRPFLSVDRPLLTAASERCRLPIYA
jgi:hypothetical protein